jgi:hypothetical protein
LEARPHLLVDGAARPGSVLVLSHWPQSPTPDVLARDLSAGIVFAFLHVLSGKAPWPGRGDKRRAGAAIIAAGELAEAVTNDHFDEDGLVSVFAAADPEMALRNEELLVEVASCGDFGVVRSRQAARIAFSIGPMGEEAVVAEDLGAERPGSFLGPRYRAVLERFAELVEHTDRFSRYWQDEDDALAEGLGDLESGRVVVEELPEVDLAVARRVKGRPLHPRGAGAGDPVAVNEVALHSATTASRVLVFDEGRCELRLRYEGWVRYVSRRVPLRPDLAPLAAELSALEPTGRAWAAGGVGSLVTRMRPVPEVTGLDPEVIKNAVVGYLKTAPGVWDPFRHGGALVPLGERRPLSRIARAGS